MQAMTNLIGVTEAAERLRKSVRWLYRHIEEYKTEYEDIPTLRVVCDERGHPVKKDSVK